MFRQGLDRSRRWHRFSRENNDTEWTRCFRKATLEISTTVAGCEECDERHILEIEITFSKQPGKGPCTWRTHYTKSWSSRTWAMGGQTSERIQKSHWATKGSSSTCRYLDTQYVAEAYVAAGRLNRRNVIGQRPGGWADVCWGKPWGKTRCVAMCVCVQIPRECRGKYNSHLHLASNSNDHKSTSRGMIMNGPRLNPR